MCLHLSFRSIAIENATIEKPLEPCTNYIIYSEVSPFAKNEILLNMKNASGH